MRATQVIDQRVSGPQKSKAGVLADFVTGCPL